MKKTLILVIVTAILSCHTSNQSRAEKKIKSYLNSTLNDPNSYESVNFTALYKMRDTVIYFGGKLDTVKYNGQFEIGHTYRSKNLMGGLVTKTEWFQLDSALIKVSCCFAGNASHHESHN